MEQNEISVGISNHTVGAGGLITQANAVGNPTVYALQVGTFATGCYLIQKDITTGFAEIIWKMTGTPSAVAWTQQEFGATATASAGAATMNAARGVVTSEALTTAAGSTYTLTLADTFIKAGSVVSASAKLGTATTGVPLVTKVVVTAGQAVITVLNIAATAALNGTILITVGVQ